MLFAERTLFQPFIKHQPFQFISVLRAYIPHRTKPIMPNVIFIQIPSNLVWQKREETCTVSAFCISHWRALNLGSSDTIHIYNICGLSVVNEWPCIVSGVHVLHRFDIYGHSCRSWIKWIHIDLHFHGNNMVELCFGCVMLGPNCTTDWAMVILILIHSLRDSKFIWF